MELKAFKEESQTTIENNLLHQRRDDPEKLEKEDHNKKKVD